MGNHNSTAPPVPDRPLIYNQSQNQNNEQPNDMTDALETIQLISNPQDATKTPESIGKTIGLITRILSKFSGKKQFGKHTKRNKRTKHTSQKKHSRSRKSRKSSHRKSRRKSSHTNKK